MDITCWKIENVLKFTLIRQPHFICICILFTTIYGLYAQETPTYERLIPFIHPYDNYGTLEAFAFNKETGILVYVLSTGEIKSYNIYSRKWTTHTTVECKDITVDVSDDGYIFVCCPLSNSLLIDTRKTNNALQTISNVHFASFIPGTGTILLGDDPSNESENSLCIYTYPDIKPVNTMEISWKGKRKSDTAYLTSVKRYGNKLIAEAGLNRSPYFRDCDTMHVDTLYQCKSWNKIAFDLPGLKHGCILSNMTDDINFFITPSKYSFVPDTIMCQNRPYSTSIVMGDVFASKTRLLFSINNKVIDLNVKTGKFITFGEIPYTRTFYDQVRDVKYEDINGYEQYVGLFYTKERNILTVNRNGEVLLWNFEEK